MSVQSTPSLFLVGMPGAGKSTVARQLARHCGVTALDADTEIEKRIGESIRSYFEHEGEAAFRELEEQMIDELTCQSPVVLATGGGAVLRPLNRQRLRERGTVIYLHASPENLFRRLRQDTKRPLLQVQDPLARLRSLYEQRDPLYRESAHFVIETGRTSVATLVNMVVTQLELAGVIAPHH